MYPIIVILLLLNCHNVIIYRFIQRDFEKYCIDISGCKIYNESQFPVSTIVINSENGSRTIVHSNKDLPELDYEHFKNIDLRNYSWIHFEVSIIT